MLFSLGGLEVFNGIFSCFDLVNNRSMADKLPLEFLLVENISLANTLLLELF